MNYEIVAVPWNNSEMCKTAFLRIRAELNASSHSRNIKLLSIQAYRQSRPLQDHKLLTHWERGLHAASKRESSVYSSTACTNSMFPYRHLQSEILQRIGSRRFHVARYKATRVFNMKWAFVANINSQRKFGTHENINSKPTNECLIWIRYRVNT